ncbi:MAG: hypothetical protein ABI036_01565 [Fibrobacteria bacterium]
MKNTCTMAIHALAILCCQGIQAEPVVESMVNFPGNSGSACNTKNGHSAFVVNENTDRKAPGFDLVRVMPSGPPASTHFETDQGAWASPILQTFDGGYVIGGYLETDDPRVGYHGVGFLLRVDSSGNTLWRKPFPTAEGIKSVDIILQMPDSGFTISGSSSDSFDEITHPVVIRLDKNGIFLGRRKYSNEFAVCRAILKTPEGGFIMAGESRKALSPTGRDATLMKTDSLGNPLWVRTYIHFGEGDRVLDLDTTENGGYILAGAATGVWPEPYRVLTLLKTDSLGNKIWDSSYRGHLQEEEVVSVMAMDGGFIGLANAAGAALVFKMDTNGIMRWYLPEWNGHYSGGSHHLVKHGPGQFSVLSENPNYGGAHLVRYVDSEFSTPGSGAGIQP